MKVGRSRYLARGFLLAALLSGLPGCDSARQRPSGLDEALPPTTVRLLAPVDGGWVPSDSVASIVVEASGLVTALGYVMTWNLQPDTLGIARRQFDEPVDSVQLEFRLVVPELNTGIHLEIVGIAEDLLGGRHLSDAAVVTVIECDVFPAVCAGG